MPTREFVRKFVRQTFKLGVEKKPEECRGKVIKEAPPEVKKFLRGRDDPA